MLPTTTVLAHLGPDHLAAWAALPLSAVLLVRRPQPAAGPPSATRSRRLLLAAVIGGLVFQFLHLVEHLAQLGFWLLRPATAPWLTPWADGAVLSLAGGATGDRTLGIELLHLGGNVVFLAALLGLLLIVPAARAERWVRVATWVQGLHVAEHLALTSTYLLLGAPHGLSDAFGVLEPGSTLAMSWRVWLHFGVNLAATAAAAVGIIRAGLLDRVLSGRRRRTGVQLSAALLAGGLLLGACSGQRSTPSAAATVEGSTITGAAVDDGVTSALADPSVAAQVRDDPDLRAQLRAEVTQQLVRAELARVAAADLGIELTPDDVADRMRRLVAEDFGSEEAFATFAADNGVTDAALRQQVSDLLLQERIQTRLTAGMVISHDEIAEVYDQRYEGVPQGRHILLSSVTEAEAVLDELRDGAAFVDLIATRSEDPRAQTEGGDLGPLIIGQTVTEIVDAVQGIADGEVVGPVATQFGFHLVQRMPPATLADVEDEIRFTIRLDAEMEAAQTWMAELLETAEIRIDPAIGTWDPTTGIVPPA